MFILSFNTNKGVVSLMEETQQALRTKSCRYLQDNNLTFKGECTLYSLNDEGILCPAQEQEVDFQFALSFPDDYADYQLNGWECIESC